jgi:REP-associated tyrosine transposase
MPRPPRVCPDGVPQHVVNRGNLRAQIFRDGADYLGFLAAMTDAVDRTTVRLLAFCLMPNHFHLVLWPVHGPEVSAYMQLLMNAHIRDVQHRHGTAGTGHVYQGRYKNSPILTERHFINVCRYVEGNPLCAGLVAQAQQWEWSSLIRAGPVDDLNILSPWPVGRPRKWIDLVNRPLGNRELRELKKEMRRQRQIVRAMGTWTAWVA